MVEPFGAKLADRVTVHLPAVTDAVVNPGARLSSGEEDLVRTVIGTRFDQEIFYHNGALADPGWYVNGIQNNAFTLKPAKAYFIFIKGPGSMVWRPKRPAPTS
jgi:hypothetical protein